MLEVPGPRQTPIMGSLLGKENLTNKDDTHCRLGTQIGCGHNLAIRLAIGGYRWVATGAAQDIRINGGTCVTSDTIVTPHISLGDASLIR